MNIQLNYLYRDGGNYKQHGFEVFTNVTELATETIDAAIRSKLIDGNWFFANKWQLPDLHNYDWSNVIDHEWHEYEQVTSTKEHETKGDIENFLSLIGA